MIIVRQLAELIIDNCLYVSQNRLATIKQGG